MQQHKPWVILFFVGTTAELIKIFVTIKQAKVRGVEHYLVSSGQHNLAGISLIQMAGSPEIKLTLSNGPSRQSTLSLLFWFLRTLVLGRRPMRKLVKSFTGKNVMVVVHGDTISTLLGALLAKLSGAKLGHIEAGLRSFNLFNPFPEELTRQVVSKLVDLHLCPNAWSLANLNRLNGTKVNTIHNSLIESLEIVLQDFKPEKDIPPKLQEHIAAPFFIFVMHRQENLYDHNFVREMVENVLNFASNKKCIFIIHGPTRVTLEKLDLLKKVQQAPNVCAVDRLPYALFMHLVSKADFLLTDGGSNQEDSSYLGVPCAVLRKVTERIEGIGENVVISAKDISKVREFVANYEQYRRKAISLKDNRPSQIILDAIVTYGE